jgi:hypothetical protein
MDKLTYDSLAEVFKQCHSKPNYVAGIFIPDYRRQKEFADEMMQLTSRVLADRRRLRSDALRGARICNNPIDFTSKILFENGSYITTNVYDSDVKFNSLLYDGLCVSDEILKNLDATVVPYGWFASDTEDESSLNDFLSSFKIT